MLIEFSMLTFGRYKYKKAACKYLSIQFAASLLLSCCPVAVVTADPAEDKYYLRIAHNSSSDNNDLSITSIGMLSFTDNLKSHIDFTHINSDKNGEALALDLGGGYVYTGNVSLYLSFGISLGYDWNNDDYIASYYPEAGMVMDLTKTFGITVSGKRYFNLYSEEENIIMLGLVFRE